MKNLHVTFHIPDWIQQGLNNNKYKRFGGIIRETNSGNIIAHLRETSSCIDKALLSLTTAGSLVSILNLGITVVSFTFILNKLNELNHKLITIESTLQRIEVKIDNINSKIDLGFKSELLGSLNQLNKAMLLDDFTLRKQLIVNIVSSFEKSKELYKDLLLKSCKDFFYEYESFLYLYHLYIFLYLSYLCLTISYLELEELHISNKVLEEGLNILKEVYDEILLVDEDTYDVEKLEEEFLCMFEYCSSESLIIPASSLIEFVFLGEKLKPDHREIKIRNEEKTKHARQVIKDLRTIYSSLENFMEEIKSIQQLKLTWWEWKAIKPVEHNSESEYIYIITNTSAAQS